MQETFFDKIDHKYKLKVDGETLHDTAIIPNFAKNYLHVDIDSVWKKLLKCPTQNVNEAIERRFNYPRWIPGGHVDLRYRGNAINRSKLWFQNGVSKCMKYSYTGWNYGICNATYDVKSVDGLESFTERINKYFDIKMNHWIVTKYKDGNDSIGQHSDKSGNWEKNSAFIVVKMGEKRPFRFTKTIIEKNEDGSIKVDKKGNSKTREIVIWEKELEAGTAIIVGETANTLVKHGVPKTNNNVGVSASIVGRAIDVAINWNIVDKKQFELRKTRAKRKLEKETSQSLKRAKN